jgi:long-chain fatty acid transport protein
MDSRCLKSTRRTIGRPSVSSARSDRFGLNCPNTRQTLVLAGQSGRKSTNQLTVTETSMNTEQNTRFTFLLALSLALVPAGANAVGFRLPNQDPDAIARGNAFVATADNPSAIYYNPAGITQLEGQSIRAGMYLVSGGYTYESPTGGEWKADSDFQPVPQFYYVFSPKDFPLSFGLGVYAPYGLSLDWGNNTPFATAAEKGSLTYLTINPVVAWKIHPALSLAIGPTINYSSADFRRGIGIMPGDQFRLQGNSWAYGFNAGLRWQPHEKWAFGLSYRSTTTVDYSGTADTTPSPPYPPSLSTSASIRFPQFIVGGVSFRPTEDWNFEFDLDWADWSSVNQIVIEKTAFGKQVWPLNYRSSFMYEFGVTRQLGKGYFGSVGFFYSENSSPNQDFNPIIPDTDLYLGSAGFGYKGKHWDWTVAYQFGYNPGREVTGDKSFPSANGTYKVFNQGINVAATFKF